MPQQWMALKQINSEWGLLVKTICVKDPCLTQMIQC